MVVDLSGDDTCFVIGALKRLGLRPRGIGSTARYRSGREMERPPPQQDRAAANVFPDVSASQLLRSIMSVGIGTLRRIQIEFEPLWPTFPEWLSGGTDICAIPTLATSPNRCGGMSLLCRLVLNIRQFWDCRTRGCVDQQRDAYADPLECQCPIFREMRSHRESRRQRGSSSPPTAEDRRARHLDCFLSLAAI